MGILNITPDSFSDGGAFFEPVKAIDHALALAEDGADIIDIGGESTRPGSDSISVEEELGRILPVIKALAGRIPIPLSVDTYKSEVARAALEAGAEMVNDISGLRFDPEMATLIARHQVPVVLMHIKGTPKSMQANPTYDNLMAEIKEYLRESIELARAAGIAEDRIIIDPGIGFGKTFDHNLEVIRRLSEFQELKKPVLVGPSRKAFIGKVLGNLPVTDRLEGTAAAVAISILNGANIVRVHDVKAMARVARIADAIIRS